MAPLVSRHWCSGYPLLTLIRGILGAELSLWTVGIGHVLLCLPYSVAILLARLGGFDPNLEEASMDLGQSGLGTFRRVTMP
jgi:spermidine/putrescine transport system permease protein